MYTEADQAKRGEPLYSQYCASCHGPDLSGGEMAPGLTGGEFASNWNDLSLGDLFERIRVSMPQNAPGSLSRQQNADILAYVLSKATVPAGSTELPTQTELLNGIKFVGQKPRAVTTITQIANRRVASDLSARSSTSRSPCRCSRVRHPEPAARDLCGSAFLGLAKFLREPV